MNALWIGIALALVSSLTSASAHGLLKAGRDKLAVRAMIGMTDAAVMFPFCFLVPLPAADLWPWLIFACSLHTAYQMVLVRSYETSDFAVAFPIARGIAPFATAVLGIMLLGDRITILGMLGIACVSAGIVLLAAGRSISKAGLFWAIIAGLMTTTYTLVDAHAIRLASNAFTFIVWFWLFDGLFIFPIFALGRRGRMLRLLREEGRQGVTAGLITIVAFGSALLALSLAPVGMVSALRETTVLFGLLIAAVALGEPVDGKRALGAVIISAGALLIVVVTL